MESLNEKIIKGVEKIVKKSQDQALGPLNMLPLHIQENESNLEEAISKWLQYGPAVAILTGPLGSGKTIASCQLPEKLSKTILNPGASIWIQLRDADLYTSDPDESIRKLLGIKDPVDIWDRDANVTLIILDGIDEVLMIHNYDQVMKWLFILLERASRCMCKPRILLCGRDIFLEQTVINKELSEQLMVFCRLQFPFGPDTPMRLRLKPWSDDTPKRILEEWLSYQYGSDKAQSLVAQIGSKAMSSPLLFGLACDLFEKYLSNPNLQNNNNYPFLGNEWDLTSRWVTSIIDRDMFQRRLDVDLDTRRYAAQEIALYLALTDKGISGIDIEALKNISHLGLTSVKSELLENDADKLRAGCLLRENNGFFTIFHESILIHLAAEALDRLLCGYKYDEVGISFLRNPWWEQFSMVMEKPGLPILIKLIKKIINIRAVQPDSTFSEVIHYWIRYRWDLDNITSSEMPFFETASTYANDIREQIDISLAILVLFRNTVLRYISQNTGKKVSIQPNITTSLFEGREKVVPTIKINEGKSDYTKIFDLAKALLKKVKIGGTVEKGINNNRNKIFLPIATISQSAELATKISVELFGKPDNKWRTIANENFQDYMLEALFIDMPNGECFGLQNTISKMTAKEIIDRIIEELKIKMPSMNNQGFQGSLYLLAINDDGTVSKMGDDNTLEQFGICSYDTLILDGWFIPDMLKQLIGKGSPLLEETLSDRSSYEEQGASTNLLTNNDINNKEKHKIIPIPGGQYPVLKKDEQGYRRILPTVIRPKVYIYENLVTVEEYADFIRENPTMPLPEQLNAGWKNDGYQIHYNPSAGNLPVTGISRKEAEEYLKWFSQKNKSIGVSFLSYRLPRPEWLQLASVGTQIEDLPPDGNGPFGHKDLTGNVWQWTDAEEGNNALVFGGSKILEDEIKGSAQKKLNRWFPDLCNRISPDARNAHVGFRICIVDLSNNPDETNGKGDLHE